VYLEPYRMTMNLKFDSKVTGTNYSIYKYTFVEQGQEQYVGDETLDGRYIRLVSNSINCRILPLL